MCMLKDVHMSVFRSVLEGPDVLQYRRFPKMMCLALALFRRLKSLIRLSSSSR